MKTYDIWVEGYAATVDRGTAHRVTREEGISFSDACDNAYKKGKFKGYGSFNNPINSRPSLWGCRLYDNEADARKSFG